MPQKYLKRTMTEMRIMGSTTLQHEDGMYLAETRSCVNKENSCARLETVTVLNQWSGIILTQSLTKHILRVLFSLTDTREFRMSAKLLIPGLWACANCHHASELWCPIPHCTLVKLYIYHTVTEDVNWIIVTAYGSRTLYLTTGCIIVPLCLMGWLHTFKFWSFVCSDHTG